MKRRKKITTLLLITFIFLELTITAHAKTQNTIIVDKNGNGDYTTIQSAIDNAHQGSTILVKKGTYPEILNIQKQLTLLGEDKTETYINPISKENKYAVRLGAPEAVLEGFTVSNGAPGLYSNAIRITSTGVKIANCNIIDTPVGIAVFTSDNAIENCVFKGCKDEGIALLGSQYTECDNNQILNCIFYENCDGIELQYSSNNKISNCEIYDNTHTGIDAISQSNDKNTISNCKIYKNKVHGIYLSASSDNQILDCELSENNNGNVKINGDSENNIIEPEPKEDNKIIQNNKITQNIKSINVEPNKKEEEKSFLTRFLEYLSKLIIPQTMPFYVFL